MDSAAGRAIGSDSSLPDEDSGSAMPGSGVGSYPAGSSGAASNMLTAAAGVATGSGPVAFWPGRRRGRPVTAAMASSMRSR